MVETLRREKEGRKGNRRGERERKRGVRGKREREIEREGDRERGGKRERERRLRNSSCPVKVVLHQKRGKKMEFKLGNFCSNNHLLLSNSDTKPTALWPSRTAVRVPTC